MYGCIDVYNNGLSIIPTIVTMQLYPWLSVILLLIGNTKKLFWLGFSKNPKLILEVIVLVIVLGGDTLADNMCLNFFFIYLPLSIHIYTRSICNLYLLVWAYYEGGWSEESPKSDFFFLLYTQYIMYLTKRISFVLIESVIP